MGIVKWRTLYVIKVTFSNEITKVWYMKINSLFKKYFLETEKIVRHILILNFFMIKIDFRRIF